MSCAWSTVFYFTTSAKRKSNQECSIRLNAACSMFFFSPCVCYFSFAFRIILVSGQKQNWHRPPTPAIAAEISQQKSKQNSRATKSFIWLVFLWIQNDKQRILILFLHSFGRCRTVWLESLVCASKDLYITTRQTNDHTTRYLVAKCLQSFIKNLQNTHERSELRTRTNRNEKRSSAQPIAVQVEDFSIYAWISACY